MTPCKALTLFPEDLKPDSTGTEFIYITLADFASVQAGKYPLIVFFDTREAENIVYCTKILKNNLIGKK